MIAVTFSQGLEKLHEKKWQWTECFVDHNQQCEQNETVSDWSNVIFPIGLLSSPESMTSCLATGRYDFQC